MGHLPWPMLNNRRVYIPIYSSHQDDSWFWQGDYGKVIWAPCVAFSARWQIPQLLLPVLLVKSLSCLVANTFRSWGIQCRCSAESIFSVFLGGLSLDPCSESQTPRVSRNSQFLGMISIDDLWGFTYFLRLSSSQSVKIIRGYLNTMISWRTVHVLQVASTPEPQGVSKAR